MSADGAVDGRYMLLEVESLLGTSTSRREDAVDLCRRGRKCGGVLLRDKRLLLTSFTDEGFRVSGTV